MDSSLPFPCHYTLCTCTSCDPSTSSNFYSAKNKYKSNGLSSLNFLIYTDLLDYSQFNGLTADLQKRKKNSWYTWIKVLFPDSIKKKEETLSGFSSFDRIAGLIFMHKTQQLEEVFKLDNFPWCWTRMKLKDCFVFHINL